MICRFPAFALCALTLLAPSIAAAACSGHEEARLSCAEGLQWNPETRACETASS
ncbi:adenylosuccinate lyase [Gemmobacter serpentinus]|uniref:adenylosuccinate lyase n=1 Tax=Gemmobacter serpentinus TaxID=2652247 RepID=UPI00124CD894|nr:adenylosuccinate lyase [Gemmobacter serpentinus]